MSRKSMRVLIVDDEISIVNWLVKNVDWETYNYEVVGTATDVESALHFIEAHPVDLILTDICMPDRSGLDLIKRVRDQGRDVLIIVISAFDRFSYVKEAFQYGIVNYCLKPIDVEEIHKCLKDAEMVFRQRLLDKQVQDNRMIRNSVFQSLINDAAESSRLKEQCDLVGIDLNVSTFQVGLLRFKTQGMEKYMSFLRKFEKQKLDHLYCFLDGRMDLVFLFLGEKNCDRDAEDMIGEFLREEGVVEETFFCVSRPFHTYMKIGESYRICRDFSDAEFLFTGRTQHLEKYPYEKYLQVLKDKDLQRLGYDLKEKAHDNVIAFMQKRVGEFSKEEEKKAELICLAVFLIRQLSSAYPGYKMPCPESAMEEQSCAEGMLVWLENFYRVWVENLSGQNEYFHPHVRRALKAVSSCYSDSNLSLQEIARECDVTAAYLGRLFKEQTGEFFGDYLLSVRLEKAQQLLNEKKYRIGEVAAEVGFANTSYFIKMFRRSYGVSPVEYRRNYFGETRL